MGACCSAPGEELPAATADEVRRLRQEGHLPCLAVPSVDLEGDNALETVYVAEYENGTELTFSFLDEDRTNKCEDCLYDAIRRPLFGRFSDIETVIIVDNKVEFPGTYSGEQKWDTKVPEHGHAVVDLSTFVTRNNSDFILWVNTWNHLLGDKNNNTQAEITYCDMNPIGVTESKTEREGNFVLRKGSRAEVDARFKGLMTSVSTVMTPETREKLGKRLF